MSQELVQPVVQHEVQRCLCVGFFPRYRITREVVYFVQKYLTFMSSYTIMYLG